MKKGVVPPHHALHSVPSSSSPSTTFDNTTTLHLPVSAHPHLPGLLALHIRRGDYARHCPRLAGWGATFMGLNQLPLLPDRFLVPAFTSYTSRADYYRERCWQTTEEIIAKLREVRREWALNHPVTDRPAAGGAADGLREVFVLTNGGSGWVEELRAGLLADGWAAVRSSYDMELDPAQPGVSVGVDMAVAEATEVSASSEKDSLHASASEQVRVSCSVYGSGREYPVARLE